MFYRKCRAGHQHLAFAQSNVPNVSRVLTSTINLSASDLGRQGDLPRDIKPGSHSRQASLFKLPRLLFFTL
eukprot:2134917-Rhodomonas_salina.1